jgi:predicted transcriptional regulator
LSIRPDFVEAIIRGEKKFEFRRSIFARPVDVVIVYATVPVQRVVAEFDVCSIISEKLPTLWKRTHKSAGIGREFFLKYFEGKDYGHAIEIGKVRLYKMPFCPIEKFGIRPPQSFVYL